MKKIPLRTCIITKEKCEKHNLLRIVRTPSGEIVFDKTGKQNGKGAYLKKDLKVIEKAKANKSLDHLFEKEVPLQVYESLLKEVNSE
ncbi:MAG: YlxR family protein [Mollicutes bacterium]|nr:YlxR family protein [Mollicutes bacterium]